MKAAVYYGKHNLVVEDVPVRELKDNEVLIQVKYCGVCGTDVHAQPDPRGHCLQLRRGGSAAPGSRRRTQVGQ